MKKIDLLKDDIKKLYIRYLLPSICATMITSVYIIADTIMVGHGIGENALVALNLLLPVYSFLFGIGNMLGIGGGVLVSIAMGTNNKVRVKEVFSTAIISALILSVFLTMLFVLCTEDICYLLGANITTIDYAIDYGSILFRGIPIFIFSATLQGFIRNDKAPNKAMCAVIAGSVINIGLDYLFIYILDMEMRGAIAATVIGYIINFVICLSHLLSKKCNLKFEMSSIKLSVFREIFVAGFTSMLVELASGITTFVFNIQIIKYLKDVGVVVYSVITNSIIVCNSIFTGASQTTQPIIANNYGAGFKERVNQVRRLGFKVIITFSIIFLIYVNILPKTLIDAFVSANNNIYSVGVYAIRIYFACLIPMAVNIYYSTYLQSIVKAGKAFIITCLRGIFLNIILVLIIPGIFGSVGIWYVVPITEIITMIIALTLVKSDDTINASVA